MSVQGQPDLCASYWAYHQQRLWDELAAGNFDWPRLLEHHKMTGDEALSADFIAQIQPLCLSSSLSEAALMTRLQDACELARSAFIGAGALQKKLELIYRSRTAKSPKRNQSSPEATPPVALAEGGKLVDAISTDQPAEQKTANLSGLDLQTLASKLAEGTAFSIISVRLRGWAGGPPKRKAPRQVGDVIGTQVFHYNEAELSKYVEHVSQFWRSERAPQGVPIEDV
jgi:hypothetical protein